MKPCFMECEKTLFNHHPYSFKINWNDTIFHISDHLEIYFSRILDESSVKPLYATMVGEKFQIYGVQITEKCICKSILNLDIFTCVPLQTKLSSKFLSSLSGLIQIHITAIKHKKSQVIYTYQLTIKQIFMSKVMFFMKCGY